MQMSKKIEKIILITAIDDFGGENNQGTSALDEIIPILEKRLEGVVLIDYDSVDGAITFKRKNNGQNGIEIQFQDRKVYWEVK